MLKCWESGKKITNLDVSVKKDKFFLPFLVFTKIHLGISQKSNKSPYYSRFTASGIFHYFRTMLYQKPKNSFGIKLLYKQLWSGPISQSYLHFQDFRESKLLNGCLAFWPSKQILSVFLLFFRRQHWHTVYL